MRLEGIHAGAAVRFRPVSASDFFCTHEARRSVTPFAVAEPEDVRGAVAGTGRVVRVTVSGEIDLATALQLGDALRHAEEHAGGLILDLSGVEFIDRRGAQLLLATVRRVRARGVRFTLDGASDAVMPLLGAMGVEHELHRDRTCPSDRRDRRFPPRPALWRRALRGATEPASRKGWPDGPPRELPLARRATGLP